MFNIPSSRLFSVALPLVFLFVIVPLALHGFDRGYFYQIASLVLIFVLLAASLNLVAGTAGLLHLGHAAFYGVGAYTAALLGADYGVGFTLGLPLAGVVAAFLAFLVALPTMRLVSIYFAVATLAIGQMLYLIMLNWVGFTKGPNGVMLFDGMNLFGFDITSDNGIYFVVAAVVTISIYLIHRISHSYYGNGLRALREDDQCTDAMGVNTVRLKIEVFTLSAFFAGLAGALWSYTTGYISPKDFDFSVSIQILAMVVVGGLGSLPGAIIGAALLILLPEVLRDVGDFRNIAVGLVMFFAILFLPKGLFGEVSALSLVRRHIGDRWQHAPGDKKVGWR
ncbi:branched-chain amino acid ABC transporter permease [Martelella mediterranea]|uniref:Branched-chain amino acid transport system permease protein n=1 Tax=Martelella mediterranea TaxID=293089 RepID=A0A4V2V4Z2_9HYPH|nr:branched-chain amino acid ABC transporter permease [Martelella mediterranea]TCT44961.1 branched-chain amino acid transport system permease protein [Martelella mediterranea]